MPHSGSSIIPIKKEKNSKDNLIAQFNTDKFIKHLVPKWVLQEQNL